jgi:aryl-alcohol dehydrogenase-like predicted oxidoreductase
MAQSENLGVTTYSPLGGGLLTGKYGRAKRPESGRLIESRIYETRYNQDWMFDAAEKFTALAEAHNFHPASLGVAWVASHPAVTAPIIGARNVGQLEMSIKSLEIDMTPDLRNAISSLSPDPPPATDRSEEGTKHSFFVR